MISFFHSKRLACMALLLALALALFPAAASAAVIYQSPASGIASTFTSSLTAGTVTLSNDGTTKPLTSDSLLIAANGATGVVDSPGFTIDGSSGGDMKLAYLKLKYYLKTSASFAGTYRVSLWVNDPSYPFEVPLTHFKSKAGEDGTVVNGFTVTSKELAAVNSKNPNVRFTGGTTTGNKLRVYLTSATGDLWLSDISIETTSPGYTDAAWNAFESGAGPQYVMTQGNGLQPQYARTGDFVSASVMDTAHKLMAVSGFNMNREWINWQDTASRTDYRLNIVNTNPAVTVGGGNADYSASLSELEGMVDNLNYYGIDSLLVLQGTPDWTHPGKINNIADGPHGGFSNPGNPNGLGDPYPSPQPFDTSSPHWEYPPNSWSDYEDMVSALVTKLNGKVKAYEIINEANVNGQGNNVGGYKTLTQYMKHFYTTAKAIDPNAQILTSASDKMLAGMVAEGALDYADGAAYHGYTGNLSGMRGTVESSGSMKHIWLTEHWDRHPELTGKVRSQGRWTVFSVFENTASFNDHRLMELRDASGSRVVGNQPQGLGDRIAIANELYDYGTMTGKLAGGNYDGASVADRIQVEVLAPNQITYGSTQTITLRATNTSTTTFTNVHLWPVGFVDNLGYGSLSAIRAKDQLVASFAPGQSVSLTLNVTPTTTLYKAGGTYQVGLAVTNDQGKHSLGLRNMTVTDEIVVDNAGTGYAETGANWQQSLIGGAYSGLSRWNNSLSAAQYATFTPNIPAAGNYDVYVWKFDNHTSSTASASFTVNYSGGSSSFVVNQTTAARTWQKLGTFSFAAGTGGNVRVSALPGDGKTVRADAVKFVRSEYLIDNGDSGYAETGSSWGASAIAGAYGGSARWNGSQAATDSATFTPNLTTAGNYDVYVWKFDNHTSNTASANYTVNYNGGSSSFVVNQTTPTLQWQKLGTFNFAAGTGGNVKLGAITGDGKGVRADAVKFVLADIDPEPTIILDYGDIEFATVGAWSTSTIGGAYNGSNLWIADQAGVSAEWRPNFIVPGDYDVYVWKFDDAATNTTSAKYTVHDASGDTLYTVNQKTPVDQWQLLGTHTFAEGSGGYVKLSGDTADGFGARADAVKFVKK